MLLQRYLDNLLAHQQLQSDPALWLFVESERFPEMIGEFRLAEKSPEATAPVEAIKDPQFYQDDVCMYGGCPPPAADDGAPVVGGAAGVLAKDYRPVGNPQECPV